MRHVFRIIFMALTALALAAWAAGYVWIMSLACAYGSPNTSSCTITYPWQLTGEDLTLLVVTPAAIIGLLVLVIYLLRPQKSDS